MKTKPNKQINKARVYLIVSAFILLTVGAGLFYFISNQASENTKKENGTNSKSTTEEQREVELKESPEEKLNNQSDTPDQPTINESTGKQKVNVIVTDAGVYDEQVEARGFVSNTIESSGNCTYGFTRGAETVTKVSQPLANSTSTTCQTVKFSSSELGPGKWTVTLMFKSTSSEGKSEPREFIVP